jgi:uncharacterized protein with GYD domain
MSSAVVFDDSMFFVVLAKMRGEITPEFREATKVAMECPPAGVKIHNVFWTLGQYDFVIIYEAPSEKEAVQMGVAWVKFCETQTMVAVPQDEAQKLFG